MGTPFSVEDPGSPWALTHAQRIERLVEIERKRDALDAEELELLAVLAVDPVQSDRDVAIEKQWVREEVACALRIAPHTAADRLVLALDVVNRLPATLAALRSGQISVLHARALSEAAAPLPDEVATVLETGVLTRAGEQTVGEFRRCVRRAVAKLDARKVEERHQDAVAQRRVVLTAVADGMTELWALLPADAATSLITALDALASDPGLPDPTEAGLPNQGIDCRTADQRRADALTLLATHVLHHGADTAAGTSGVGSWQGQRPSIQVTVALSTLLGLDEQPGELDRHGPIPASLARRLAGDPTGTWRRLLTDEHGQLLDYSRHVYRPPANLRDHVITRDQTCRMPGCLRTARRCELDHIQAWATGGHTTDDDLETRCPRHHHLKHEAEWTVTRTPTGATECTTPTGHHYTKPPAQLPIDHTADPPPPF
jgi:hypothetical protein